MKVRTFITKEKKEQEQWDIIIEPGKGRKGNGWREVWQYRELILMFVKRDFKTMYAQTVLGPLWLVITALLSSSIMTLVFGKLRIFLQTKCHSFCFTCRAIFYGVIFQAV